MSQVVISGTGVHSPSGLISNEELVAAYNSYAAAFNAEHAIEIASGECPPLLESSVEFIEKASGIKQRHVVEKSGILDPKRMYPRLSQRPDDQLSLQAEFAVAAAQQALANAGKTGSQVDAVLCACSGHQRIFPAMAVEIQNAIGAGGYAFDMNIACSSATFAIAQAANAILAGGANCVLVVSPELTSAHLEWRDRDCHFIFGDVATAIVLERAETATATNCWEVLDTRLSTRFSNNIRDNFGCMLRCEDGNPDARDMLFRQEGRKVFKEVVPMAAEHIELHLAARGMAPSQVRRFWLHQANIAMNQLIGKKLLGRDANADEAPIILDRYANTASAGSIIAFHENSVDLVSGDLGVLCSFGAGYSIGSAILRKR